MQSVLTSREAWVRFACSLFHETDLSIPQIAKEADQLLIEYLQRFPDPKQQASAILLPAVEGEPEGLAFTLKKHRTDVALTDSDRAAPSGDSI